jgi:hypothetical protein
MTSCLSGPAIFALVHSYSLAVTDSGCASDGMPVVLSPKSPMTLSSLATHELLQLPRQHLVTFVERYYGGTLHMVQIRPLQGGLQAAGVFRIAVSSRHCPTGPYAPRTRYSAWSHPQVATAAPMRRRALAHRVRGRDLVLVPAPTVLLLGVSVWPDPWEERQDDKG